MKVCERCGSTWMVSTHHDPPKKMGGSKNWEGVLRNLCIKCHSAEHGIKVVASQPGWRE